MTEQKAATVAYFKDAKIGDLVWRIAGNENVYGEDRVYQGRGRWYLEPITKIARKYLTVGNGHEFEIGSGWPRSVNGYAPPDHAYGEIERWMTVNKGKIEREVSDCRDAAALVEVGKIFGIVPPPQP